MEDAEEYSELTEKYNHLYFFRNICSPLLAELFVKELKTSKIIQESIDGDGKDKINTLFDLLKHVDNKGKRNKERKKESAKTQGASNSGTFQINNIKLNKEILEKVSIKELQEEERRGEAVRKLSLLEVKFLLYLLTNNVLDFAFKNDSEMRKVLEELQELRNSDTHQDKDKNRHVKIWKNNKYVHAYLDKDSASFPKLQECFPFRSQNKILKDVQREIYESYKNSHHQDHATQLTIQHRLPGEYCQPIKTVKELVKFLVEKKVSCCQEPQPIVLHGEPGAGKSSILQSLIHTIANPEKHKDFNIVVKVSETFSNSKKEFWKQVFSQITSLSPQAMQKHGREKVEEVLSIYASSFLFVMDHNLRDTAMLYQQIIYLDRGTWVLSFQGCIDPSSRFHVLKVAPLSKEKVDKILEGIKEMPKEERKRVSRTYRECEYKELIQTPDMVKIFAETCLKLKGCASFHELMRTYIYKYANKTEETENYLIMLGEKAFYAILENEKYYPTESLDHLKSIADPFIESNSFGYFFKSRRVEDYLAAKYVVKHPAVACKLMMENAESFKAVFHIVCAMWSEQDRGIDNNLDHIRPYLEELFKEGWSQKNRGKKRERNTDTSKTEYGTMQRWILISKIAKDNQNNPAILRLLADLLTRFHTWLFKHTSLTKDLTESLSQVLEYVTLTENLTIMIVSNTSGKEKSQPGQECGTKKDALSQLTQLWYMLSSQAGLRGNTFVHLTICCTESNVDQNKSLLSDFFAEVYNTTTSLLITDYTGPLLCSQTPKFFECPCMTAMKVLNVDIYDLTSLGMVLEQHHKVKNITVRLRLEAVETVILQNLRFKLSRYLDLTIIYCEGLQTLLDSFEKPQDLHTLKIYEIYINKKFSLDLTRFTKLEFLSLQFERKESKEQPSSLPREKWTSHLLKYLHLPTLERLLMRNLFFFDDSTSGLVESFKKQTLQRLILLDTEISISKFRGILQDFVTCTNTDDTEEFRICQPEVSSATPLMMFAKRQRLEKEIRELKRRNKPEGKELIITSNTELYQSSTEDWENAYNDFASLVVEMYQLQIVSIAYSGNGFSIRKDVCGDLLVQCPIPFLDDEIVKHPERQPGLRKVLKALALGQLISVDHTHLSCDGALSLLKHLKEKKGNFGRIEPFRLTIFSSLLSNCSKSDEEMKHKFTEIINDETLQQFMFGCGCKYWCKSFKKTIRGLIYINNRLSEIPCEQISVQ